MLDVAVALRGVGCVTVRTDVLEVLRGFDGALHGDSVEVFITAIGWIKLCGDGHLIADIDVGFDTGDGGGFGKGLGGAQGQCRGCECSDEANTVHSVPQRLKKKEKMV